MQNTIKMKTLPRNHYNLKWTHPVMRVSTAKKWDNQFSLIRISAYLRKLTGNADVEISGPGMLFLTN